jgi:hypothetical protein
VHGGRLIDLKCGVIRCWNANFPLYFAIGRVKSIIDLLSD